MDEKWTPEQMRVLAAEFEGPDSGPDTDQRVTAALRAAANRIEMLEEWLEDSGAL